MLACSLPPARCLVLALASSPFSWNACAFASYGGLAAGNGRDREGFQSLGGELVEEVGLHVAAVGRNRSTGSDAQCGNSPLRCASSGEEEHDAVDVVAGRRVPILCIQIFAPLPFHSCCPSQTLCGCSGCWQILFPTPDWQAQEINMGHSPALVMSKTRSISMLMESFHPLICPQHFTFIRFKSTDMCLPVD